MWRGVIEWNNFDLSMLIGIEKSLISSSPLALKGLESLQWMCQVGAARLVTSMTGDELLIYWH